MGLISSDCPSHRNTRVFSSDFAEVCPTSVYSRCYRAQIDAQRCEFHTAHSPDPSARAHPSQSRDERTKSTQSTPSSKNCLAFLCPPNTATMSALFQGSRKSSYAESDALPRTSTASTKPTPRWIGNERRRAIWAKARAASDSARDGAEFEGTARICGDGSAMPTCFEFDCYIVRLHSCKLFQRGASAEHELIAEEITMVFDNNIAFRHN